MIKVFKSAQIIHLTPQKREETKYRRDMTVGFPKEARKYHEKSNIRSK